MRKKNNFIIMLALGALLFSGCIRKDEPNDTNVSNATIAATTETAVVEFSTNDNLLSTDSAAKIEETYPENVPNVEKESSVKKDPIAPAKDPEEIAEETPINPTEESENVIEEVTTVPTKESENTVNENPSMSEDDMGWA